MRKLLLGLTAAAAFAFAIPGAALAANNNGGGHGGGGHGGGGRGGGAAAAHVSGGGHMGMSRGASRSSNRSFSNRSVHSRGHANRNFARQQNFANARVNSRNARVASNRHHRHHHRRHFNGFAFFPDSGYYDDYAGYDTCYQYVWTRWGYRYVNTCGPDYSLYY